MRLTDSTQSGNQLPINEIDNLVRVSELLTEVGAMESDKRTQLWKTQGDTTMCTKFMAQLEQATTWVDTRLDNMYSDAVGQFKDKLCPALHNDSWEIEPSLFLPASSMEVCRQIAQMTASDERSVAMMANKFSKGSDHIVLKGLGLLDRARIAGAKVVVAPLPSLPESDKRENTPSSFSNVSISQATIKQLTSLRDFDASFKELNQFVRDHRDIMSKSGLVATGVHARFAMYLIEKLSVMILAAWP